jgi:meso-butanediol dehydrogenase/(S,S)-butanediol dehydrogenase/diacetyl reductase
MTGRVDSSQCDSSRCDSSRRPQSLAGKVAVVTGASRGIGLATATSLAARGVRVAMLARNGARLDQAAKTIGDAALPVPTDISDPDAVRTAFEQVLNQFGRLNIVVNNAGMAGLHRVEEATDADLRAEVATNFLGLVYCTRQAIPKLREAGGGDIVNISSTSVKDPYPYLSMYAATKAAVETFSVAVRREVKQDGTRVIVLRCGNTWTGFGESWDAEVLAKAYQAWVAGGYVGRDGCLDPHVVGEAVAYAVASPAQACIEVLELGPTIHAPSEPPVGN